MPKLPDRWLDYSNIGDVIPGTRFIAFKVPLQQNFFSHAPRKSWFTPSMLIQSLQEKDLNIGLIIDLTFTKKYYNPKEFTDQGIQYEKIFVPGHEIPSQDILDKFYEAVDNFLETSDEDSLVGVHCTHGVNRTGYVVCRYMVDRLGMKATEALSACGKARGYPVERGNYIHDLKVRSGEASGEYEEPEHEKSKKHGHKGHRHDESRSRGEGHRGQRTDQTGCYGEGHRDHHHATGHRRHSGQNGRFHQHQDHRGQRHGDSDHYGGHSHSYRNQDQYNDRGRQYRRGYYDSSYDQHSQNDYSSHWNGSSASQWRDWSDGRSHGRSQSNRSNDSSYGQKRDFGNGSDRGNDRSYSNHQERSVSCAYNNTHGYRNFSNKTDTHRKQSDKYGNYRRQNSDPYVKPNHRSGNH